jgi:hypothetical protein
VPPAEEGRMGSDHCNCASAGRSHLPALSVSTHVCCEVVRQRVRLLSLSEAVSGSRFRMSLARTIHQEGFIAVHSSGELCMGPHLSINCQPCVALNISLAAGKPMHGASACAQTPIHLLKCS